MIKLSSGLIDRWAALLFSAYSGFSPKAGARYLAAKLGNGFAINFVGRVLQEPIGTNLTGLADNSSNVVEGNVSNTIVGAFTSNIDATAIDAATVTLESIDGGYLNFEIGNKDGQKAVAGFALGDGTIAVPLVTKSDSYVVDFSLADVTGIKLPVAKACMQFGLAGDIQADLTSELVNKVGVDAIYVEIAEQKFRLVCIVDSVFKYSAWSASMLVDGEDAYIELAVTKGAYDKQTAVASIKGKGHVGLEIPSGMVNNLSLFGRLGNKAAFDIADGYQLSCKLQSVSLVVY